MTTILVVLQLVLSLDVYYVPSPWWSFYLWRWLVPAYSPCTPGVWVDWDIRVRQYGVKTLFHSWSSPSPSSEHPLLPYLHAHFLEWLVVDGNDFTTHIELGKYKKLLQKKSRFVHKQVQTHGKWSDNVTTPTGIMFYPWRWFSTHGKLLKSQKEKTKFE